MGLAYPTTCLVCCLLYKLIIHNVTPINQTQKNTAVMRSIIDVFGRISF